MKTSAKVWLGIGGVFGLRCVAAGVINTAGYEMIEKFYTKYGETRDLLNSKQNELTEDNCRWFEQRMMQLKQEVEDMDWSRNYLITVGCMRLRILKRRVNDSIRSLKHIEDEINGLVIVSEVKD